ncbi:MAG: ExeM/NucH family extracellular endonuclease [Herpetosiphon sp.]|nr:ExeM/NucH family extracellular endonuclease [Herpetosiphon sp.]
MATSWFRRLSALVSIFMLLGTFFHASTPVRAASADLFFSEYIEGSSNNKALEIYNGTGATINLATGGYNVQMYFNGYLSAGVTINLTGSVANGDVFVVAQANAVQAILGQADQTSNANWYNGDDAIVLRKGETIIDVIGQIGFDPGSEWGTGLTSTADNTLRRKASITAGDTNGSDAFDPSVQWDGYATDTFNGLGTHGVVTSDNAPSVISTSPSNDQVDVALDSNITLTFSEVVSVANGAISVSCSKSGTKTYTISTADNKTFTLTPDANFANSETCTVTITASGVQDVDTNDPPDGMTADVLFSFTTIGTVCDAPFTPIYEIQGSGTTSLMVNEVKTFEGVVTGDFQGSTGLNGFFVQDITGDGNVATSDGMFVFVPAANSTWTNFDVVVGDEVRVTGRVIEFNTMTEVDTVTSIVKCGTASVAPVVVNLPETTNGELERYENMVVTFADTLTVNQNFLQARFGQLTLSSQGRLYNPTNLYDANTPEAIAEADLNARRVIILDDGSSRQNPPTIPYLGQDNTTRAGDTVANLTGVIDFGPSSATSGVRDYRVHPTVVPTFTRVNERTATPEPVGGNVKIASFNVLNYFTTLDQAGALCYSDEGLSRNNCRGADSTLEFTRQRNKTIAAMTAIDADVFGLMEMENNGEGATSAIQDLVNGLNAATAPGTYAFAPAPSSPFGGDAIKVAIIYKPAKVSLVGASQTSSDAIFDRPPFAQRFELVSNGEQFSVIVNHFKSKGSCPTSGLDADQGDGQGCWNAKRVQQAQALLSFINSFTAGEADDDVVVIGDLNSYGMEDPIQTLTAGGLINQIQRFIGADAYSYVFDGAAGYLDHALTSASLNDSVTGVTEWHINADEPIILDYNVEFKNTPGCTSSCTSPDLYTATPYRSSDHDPVIIGLQLNAPPVADAGGPYSVDEGSSITLHGTGSDRDGGDLAYAWDLDNNASYETSGQDVEFSAVGLTGPSTALVSLRVTDNTNLSAYDSTMITIENVAPSVDAGSGYTVNEGSSITLTANGSDPGHSPLTYAWDLDNDGSFETDGQSVQFTGGDGNQTITVAVRVTDNGGMSSVDTATVNVVNVAPTVNTPVTTPNPSIEGRVVSVSATFSDPANDAPFTCSVNFGDGSVVAGTVDNPTCSAEHTYTTFGSYTVTVSVTDKDGGTGTASVVQKVIFDFSGFFHPVDNLPTLNSVKAGSAIPIKFSLGGDKGLNIFATGYPKSEIMSCDSNAPVDGIEETVTAGSTSLSYDALTDTYSYIWKTSKSWTGTCRQLVVKFSDGTIQRANFSFR